MTKIISGNTLIAIALLLCGAVNADTTITWQGDGNQSQKMEVKGGVVRAGGEESTYVLFDAGSGNFTVVNDAQRSYMVLTQEDFDRLLGAQQRMMAQMEQQLAAMPEAQREQMREMLQQRMPEGMGDTPEPRRVDQTGDTREVSGYQCEVVHVFRGSEQVAELCMADREALGIDADDYAALREMQQFAMDMASKAAQFGAPTMDFGDLSTGRFPVSYQGFGNAMSGGANVLSSVSSDAIDPARVQVPSGYSRQQLPQMPF